MELTHASFFSGVGGLDMGLERAGWRTVSFSEIDTYASAVLAQRWPGVPNLGSITDLAGLAGASGGWERPAGGDWRDATLWSGGFPCQDLSIAGKRRGLAGERSGLAFAFLELVGRYRPPVILLENVPGLLSSHAGRDFYALQRAMADLGYLGAYRVLDARYFGVPQRRRRVFIVGVHVALDPGGQRAGQVLSVGYRCERHPPTGVKEGPGAAPRARVGVDGAIVIGARPADDARGRGTPGRGQEPRSEGREGSAGPAEPQRDAGHGQHGDAHRRPDGPTPDPGRDGAPDGLARRLDDRGRVEAITGGESSYHQRDRIYGDIAPTLDSHSHSPSDPSLVGYRKATKAREPDGWERWERDDVTDTLGVHSTTADTAIVGSSESDDDLLPLGLDSHRYRCCGNGVVSGVAEWIGLRLREIVE